MATYEQELAEWEAKRKEAWNRFYDGCISSSSIDCADYADDEIEAWERRYPRPERKLVQKPEKVEPPSRIGCQDLTYTREGVRLSSGSYFPLVGIKNLKDRTDGRLNRCTFYACDYIGTYHNGYIIIGGQRVTTAQLAAMIERCEELAREPEVDLSKRWKVVYDPKLHPNNISSFDNGCQCPANGFATREEAEAHKQSRILAGYGKDHEYVVMPYLTTKLPEKRYQVWYLESCNGPHETYNNHWGYIQGGFSTRKAAEDMLAKYASGSACYQIREVEVYPND